MDAQRRKIQGGISHFICFCNFRLCWVFVAARGLSLVAVSGRCFGCGAQASHCSVFSLRSMGSRVLGLSSCGTRAWLPRSMGDLLGPEIVPGSSALAGGFLTTGP